METPKRQKRSSSDEGLALTPPRTRMSADVYVGRIASKLAEFQNRPAREVIAPHAIARTVRELDAAARLARRVLSGDRVAGAQLAGKLGGTGPLGAGERRESRPLGAGAAALMGLARNGPIAGLPCRGQVRGDLEIMQAAFRLDIEGGYRDARITTRAGAFLRTRRDQLAGFDARLDRVLGRTAGGLEGGPFTDSPGAGGMLPPGGAGMLPPGGEGTLPPGGDLPVPGGGYGPDRDRAPLLPPASDLPDLPDQPEPNAPSGDLCLELSDLCIELFGDFAIASAADDDSQLIVEVNPACVCVDGYDETTMFTALPDPLRPFPPERGERRLIFRDLDITDRIISWSEQQIRFTIPADAHTGFVYLRRFINSASAGLGGTLANLCGFVSFGGNFPTPSPRAVLGIIRPPVIESFTVDDAAEGPITTEACTAVTLRWATRLEDLDLGLPLVPCSRISIEIRDDEGDVLHRSDDPVGGWSHNPETDVAYRLHAESWAGENRCGEAGAGPIDVQREHRLQLEPHEPGTPGIVAGRSGTFIVRLSCPAPAEGAVVELLSSDREVLRLPDTALILAGERSTPVQFGTDRDQPGRATITARLAGHTDGVLTYDVLQNLTAIVLSGGGAKGSFEAGALLFLREIWNEVRPRIICGTSVGAINALAVAEATNSSGIDKIERIWLGLQFNTDMYVPSAPVQAASNILGVPIADLLVHGAGAPSIGSVYRNVIGLTSEAAAWSAAGLAVGGTFGAAVGALLQIFVDEPVDRVRDAVNALADASFLLDLAPTAALIMANVDRMAVMNSGMTLRLATVALEDGELYYVTEAGRLLRGRAVNTSFDEAITTPDPLVIGALASAGIPAIFAPRRLDTDTTALHHVDGGVREVLPAQAAVELGAQLIYAISAAPSRPRPAPDPGRSFGDSGMLLDIAQRGLDLAVNEVAVEEKRPRAGFCDERERVLIEPNVEVHDTILIDPGLIRINIAYGWFRAFDAERLRRGDINRFQYALWVLWTDDLIRERTRCHLIETNSLMQHARNTGFFHHGTLDAIRICKNRIAELIVERFDQFGRDAFPRLLSDPVLGDQRVLDWCGTWEIHRDPHRTFLNSVNLWAAQIIAPGVAGEDGPSAPPIREPGVVARFPIPADVQAGLQNR